MLTQRQRQIRLLTTALIVFTLGFDWLAEANQTHVWNPEWHAHARFHSVWQLFTQGVLAFGALTLLWAPRVPVALRLGAIIISAVESAGFLGAYILIPAYGGSALAVAAYDVAVLGIPLNLLTYVVLMFSYAIGAWLFFREIARMRG